MASINTLERVSRNEAPPRTAAHRATYSVTPDGVVLRTYGTDNRECPERPSQIVHLSAVHLAEMLHAYLEVEAYS